MRQSSFLPAPRFLPLVIRAALAGAPLIATFTPIAVQAQAITSTHAFDIPAGALSTVLTRIAAQSGLQLTADAALIAGKNAPAIRGTLSVDAAMQQALAGSGLTAVTQDGSVTIRRVEVETTLRPVRVHASGVSTGTEGSGSYATQAVTVLKGAHSLREIPQSVSVITRQRMDDQNLNTVSEVLLNTAGISQAAAVEPTVFYSRGYLLQTQVDGSPALSLAYTSPYDSALYDRIEVLRGPAGLLSGSGEPGGTVNLVRKRPLEDFAVSGSLGAASWDRYRGDLDVSSPLNGSGSVRGRVVIAGEDLGNFVDFDYRRTLTGYGVLEADLGERTTVGLTVAAHEQKRQGSSMGGPADRPRSSFVGADVERRSTREDYGIDVTHRLPGEWIIKASLAQASHERDGKTSWLGSYDTVTGGGDLYVYPLHALYESRNADVSLDGPFELWGRQHHLTVGYNALVGEEKTDGIDWSGAPYSLGNILTDHKVPEELHLGTTGDYTKARTEQSGVFSVVRLRVLDPLTVVLGGRFSNYDRDTRTATTGWTASGERARSEFSPYGGLIWNVSEPVSLYVSYADIFIPQAEKSFDGSTLDPRVGWQGEIGAKSEFLEGRLTASLAAFRLRDKNRALQDTRYADTACDGGACYVAAGLAQSQGWELEINGAPLPGWEMSASYTRNDTKYLRDSSAENIGRPVVVSIPRHMAKLWTVYRFDGQVFSGVLNGWSVGGGINAQSETYEGRQGGYALYSLQLGYRIDSHWSLSLTGNNLTDKRYYAAAEGGTSWNIWGDPRSYALALRGQF